jgi:hypothetical protein
MVVHPEPATIFTPIGDLSGRGLNQVNVSVRIFSGFVVCVMYHKNFRGNTYKSISVYYATMNGYQAVRYCRFHR